MDKIPQEVKHMFNDKSLSLSQKLTAFMLYTDHKMIPENPNAVDHYDLGVQIKKLIDSKKISINGFDSDFNIKLVFNDFDNIERDYVML